MARTHRDIEAYLTSLGRKYDEIGELTYRIEVGDNMPPIALRISGEVVLLRALIGRAPVGSGQAQCELFRKLLELNTQELVYSAYGLDSEAIQLAAALAMPNLDINELESVLEDMGLALARHVRSLRELCKG